MGQYLTPGHVYVDGSTVTGPNLTEHVEEALFNTTAITEQELKDPAELTDQLLAVDGDEFVQLTLQQIHDLILYPGCIVQTEYQSYTANTNITAIIPQDDTIPQNTEGTEILAVSITPRFTDSLIRVQFSGWGAHSISTSSTAAIFRDAIASAIASTAVTGEPNYRVNFVIDTFNSPSTVSAVTYRVRVGPAAAATLRLNGTSAARLFGGTSGATLTLSEIKV